MQLVKVEHLKKNYRQFEAVKDISFSVEKGSIFAFLGPNGAGKSTTMKMLSTLLEPTSGTISVNDEKSPKKIRSLIGFVFQDNTLDEELTVYDNLWYRGLLYFSDLKELKKRIHVILSELQLTIIAHKTISTCSGGQKRLAMIGRALIHDPQLLILDEPTTGLDPQIRQMLWAHLVQLKEKRKLTIFFSSHYMEEANQADQVCIVHQGKILMMASPSKIIESFGDKKLTMLLQEEEVSVPVKTAQEALNILNQKKHQLRSFECTNPTLEEVFLNFTAKVQLQ